MCNFLMGYDPFMVCIQEINLTAALRVFDRKFQVFVNIEDGVKDGVGIFSLVKLGIKVRDIIIGLNGRIIGLLIDNSQFWNVYPKSGTHFKQERETFFREDLTELFSQWKDRTKYKFQLGDHNCTHRLEDSLHNAAQHIQPGLISHIQVQGLTDDFLSVHGRETVMYSRRTNSSKTRIDYIFSNTGSCYYFQYLPVVGLDHCAALARYEIDINLRYDIVPLDRKFNGWVISKILEKDEEFLDQAEYIIKKVYEESCSNKKDSTFYWLKVKSSLTNLARSREKDIQVEKTKKIEILMGFYSSIMRDIAEGQDCTMELAEVKQSLNRIYRETAREKIDKMKCLIIDNDKYDIHKLQNAKKFEGQSRIDEVEISGVRFTGTRNVVDAIHRTISEEVSSYKDGDMDSPPSREEEYFLSKLSPVILSAEEIEGLTGPTEKEEIEQILKNEVDLDSSPGEDGITYRFLKVFWKWDEFRSLYVNFLNFTRNSNSNGLINNSGIMIIKNKKGNSSDYNKKRKLTKLNKDTNLGHGKIWTNRLKAIILPKVLPKTQFNCQSDINIIDEICQIRNVNKYLLGEDISKQRNGTILSIDFKNAFRSMSLRWFKMVMRKLEIPKNFMDWFWLMYKDLYIRIVVNKYTSDKIFVLRGFLEGHPPSMGAFVVGLIPLMIGLEEAMGGITTEDRKIHRIKLFADDLKLFMGDIGEIDIASNLIERFEDVSGLEMHRNPKRNKCQEIIEGIRIGLSG